MRKRIVTLQADGCYRTYYGDHFKTYKSIEYNIMSVITIKNNEIRNREGRVKMSSFQKGNRKRMRQKQEANREKMMADEVQNQ